MLLDVTWYRDLAFRDFVQGYSAKREFHVTDIWLWYTCACIYVYTFAYVVFFLLYSAYFIHSKAVYFLFFLYLFFYLLFLFLFFLHLLEIHEIQKISITSITGSAVPLANFSRRREQRDDSLDSIRFPRSFVMFLREWLDVSHEMQTIAARLARGCSLPRLRRCVNLQFPVKWSANIRPSTCAYTMPALLSYEQHARDSVVTNPACPHVPRSI